MIRAVGLTVIQNLFAGRFADDLTPLWNIGGTLADRLTSDLVRMLACPAVSYGKGAVVGVAEDMEHGGACIHPRVSGPMRATIGGGAAVFPPT